MARQGVTTLRDVREVSSRAAASTIGRFNTAASTSAERGGRTDRPRLFAASPPVATSPAAKSAGAGSTAQGGGECRAGKGSGSKPGDAESSLVSSAWPQCQTVLAAGKVVGLGAGGLGGRLPVVWTWETSKCWIRSRRKMEMLARR